MSAAHQLPFPGRSWGGGREGNGGPFLSYTFVRHQGEEASFQTGGGWEPIFRALIIEKLKNQSLGKISERSRENMSSGTFAVRGFWVIFLPFFWLLCIFQHSYNKHLLLDNNKPKVILTVGWSCDKHLAELPLSCHLKCDVLASVDSRGAWETCSRVEFVAGFPQAFPPPSPATEWLSLPFVVVQLCLALHSGLSPCCSPLCVLSSPRDKTWPVPHGGLSSATSKLLGVPSIHMA